MNLTAACSNVYVHNPLNNRVAAARGRDARHRRVELKFRSRGVVNHTRMYKMSRGGE